jgi:energy-coupling factor transporter ATP-binding protein EcfA2
MILDFSNLSEVVKVDLPVPGDQKRILSLTALGLSRGGTAAAGTDMGSVLFWPADKARQSQAQELRSPGVPQVLDCDESAVLVGGGFRGIYALQNGLPPRLLVNDITGTTLLAIRNLEWNLADFKGGSLAFGTREGVSVARLAEVRGLNNWAYLIAGAWVTLWALYFIGIPLIAVTLQEIRREREVRVRNELGRSFEPVGMGSPSESNETMKLGDPPEKLISACAAGECVAFVGAGLGAQAGLPTWQPMMQALLTEASSQKLIDQKQAESLQAALNEGQWNVVADELVDKLADRPELLQNFLTRTYLRKDLRPTAAHHLLRSLNLSGLLSTSFDELLETTFANQVRTVYTHQDAGTLLELLTKKQFFFAKLYGALEKPGTLLIGRSQFEEAMARNPLLSRFVESLFYSRTLFFIGAGFDGIESYLAGLKISGTSERRHFALVAAHGGAWRAKADLLRRRYGIQVLAFSPQNGFSEVELFLGKLASAVRSRLASFSESGPGKIAKLKSITLKNIGPFDDMTLELDAHWTVLLGDNGVGKSTVLRAIAVGLAGSEAGESAGRLISVGKESVGGSIVLRTDAGTEYTTLITKGDRTIVQSQGSRPLEVERWLALGFPPLRTFTLTPVGDLPPRGLQRLTSSDLTPLITGELDPRPDKLKAWLVDLDYRDKDQRASNRSSWSFLRRGDTSTQFTSLIEQFFRVIRELTPGLKLGKVAIDPAKKEVHVETEDGVLRIEMVSQGTQSLLGWVGILMQRLNDFYSQGPSESTSGSSGSAQSLLEQHALVLMDEIDAHMHPKWQQQVVHSLKGLFPNVQFIATTHSPLIVAGMERREVRVARRAGKEERNAGRVIIEPPRQKLKGMRADQILTATSLFNMESTLTPDLDAARQRYTVLAAKDLRSPEEQAELDKIAENLEIRAPAPHEAEVARLAFDKMQQAFETQLGDLSPEQRQKVIEEAKVQIQENITGSRRP